MPYLSRIKLEEDKATILQCYSGRIIEWRRRELKSTSLVHCLRKMMDKRANYERHSVMSNKNSEFLKLLIVSQSRKPGKAVGCDEVAQDRGDAAKA